VLKGQIFYFSLIRKYVALFGSLFDNVVVLRVDQHGDVTGQIKVPISYAPKEKMLARVMQDPGIDRPSATPTMPLMSFEMVSMTYDASRKLRTVGKIAQQDPTNHGNALYQYNPVPYNFGFRLYALVKNVEDGTKIVEQILPYFTPDFTVSVDLIPEMGVMMDIPVVLNSISQADNYEGDYSARQSLVWTLDFTLKGFLYGPVKTGGTIRFSNTIFYTPAPSIIDLADAVGNTSPILFTQIQPGLTANGTPTSNSSLSINPNLITANSDYGYVYFETEPTV